MIVLKGKVENGNSGLMPRRTRTDSRIELFVDEGSSMFKRTVGAIAAVLAVILFFDLTTQAQDAWEENSGTPMSVCTSGLDYQQRTDGPQLGHVQMHLGSVLRYC